MSVGLKQTEQDPAGLTGRPRVVPYEKKLESGFPVFREAAAAVDGSTLRRLERNFTLFAAVGTDCFMELAGAVLVRPRTPTWISLIHRNFTHA